MLVREDPKRRALKLAAGDYVFSVSDHKLDFSPAGTNTLRAAGVDLFMNDNAMGGSVTALDLREFSEAFEQTDDGQKLNLDSISPEFFHYIQDKTYYHPSADNPDMADFIEMVNKRNCRPHENQINGTNVYTFITRGGAEGVLQIVGTTANPPGVKLRYKLAQKPPKKP